MEEQFYRLTAAHPQPWGEAQWGICVCYTFSIYSKFGRMIHWYEEDQDRVFCVQLPTSLLSLCYNFLGNSVYHKWSFHAGNYSAFIILLQCSAAVGRSVGQSVASGL